MHRRGATNLCYFLMFSTGLYYASYQLLSPALSARFSQGYWAAGLLTSAHFLGVVVSPALSGELADRVGKGRALILGCSIFVAGLLLLYLSSGAAAAFFAVLLCGLALGAVQSDISALISELNQGKELRVLSVNEFFFSFGSVAGPVAAQGLYSSGASAGAALAAPLPAFFMGALVLFALGAFKRAPASREKGSISIRLVKDRRFLMLSLCIILYSAAETGIVFRIGPYLAASGGGDALGAYCISGFWGIMAAGRLFAGAVKREGRGRYFMLSLFSTAVLAVFAVLVPGAAAKAVLISLSGFGCAAVWPYLLFECAVGFKDSSATAISLLGTAFSLGGMLSGAFLGALADYSLPLVILLSAAFAAALGAVYPKLGKQNG